MTIDPLTFILEIVNFLVLLWLLKRFLYAPIRDAITLRQQTLNHGLQEAETRELEARDTIEAYRRHLDDWNAEKAGRQQHQQSRHLQAHDIAEQPYRQRQGTGDLADKVERQENGAGDR